MGQLQSSERISRRRFRVKGMRSLAGARADEDEPESSVFVLDEAKVIQEKWCSRYVTGRHLEDDYELQSEVLGAGISGEVKLAICKSSGKRYAVKSFKKARLEKPAIGALRREVEVYLSLDHPHIARLEYVFESPEALHLVMECLEGGELFDRLEEEEFSDEVAACTTAQMLQAIAYCHAHKVIHRDLKLENFLYDKPGSDNVKLIDFGFAHTLQGTEKMTQACGTLGYVAPEVLAHSYTEKADMWSLGVIVYMMVLGCSPLSGSDAELREQTMAGKLQWSSQFSKLPQLTQAFVLSLLQVNPDLRPSAKAALTHPWVARHLKIERKKARIQTKTLQSLQSFAEGPHLKRACLNIMAGSLSSDDTAARLFEYLDQDANGTVKACDLQEALEERFNLSSEKASALVASFGDEEITYSKFRAAFFLGTEVPEDLLRETFRRFGGDADGTITERDLRATLGGSFEGLDVTELLQEIPHLRDHLSLDAFRECLVSPSSFHGENDAGDAAAQDRSFTWL
uniref:Non-specific serine/threonine protein kinase n=1 Tax=Noctiluca scintillans TaxID=2966 RepID=A0A7S1A4B1_NOCSC|mmetsp:Transcript_31257/g.83171  ORF Transcript_31257/g.83171 Transcript_31257/m.83171 type:complete len:514 (+) Transcript_31257:64-1605(+)